MIYNLTYLKETSFNLKDNRLILRFVDQSFHEIQLDKYPDKKIEYLENALAAFISRRLDKPQYGIVNTAQLITYLNGTIQNM